MDKNKLVHLLCELNNQESTESSYLDEIYENKYKEICEQLSCTEEDVGATFKNIFDLYFSSTLNAEWKYVCLNFYILNLLNIDLESQRDILSVQQSKNAKNCIRNLVKVGICTKLQPNLPLYVKTNPSIACADIFLNYNVLKCTAFGLSEFLKYPNLRILILPDNLKAILVALYQICYCPLKKPCKGVADNLMTEEVYNKLLYERSIFLKLLEHLRETIHPRIFVKETMVIFQADAPTWFKRNVAKSLTNIIRAKDGVETIATALLNGVTDDSTQTWNILEVLLKLILSCKNFSDFKSNICEQLKGMLDIVTDESLILERVFIHCTKGLYQEDQEVAKNMFVRKIVNYFSRFACKDHKFDDGEVLTKKFTQYVRITHSLFVENTPNSQNLPLEMLKPLINILFRLCAVTSNTSFKSTNNELQNILTSFLKGNSVDRFHLFDSFLFEINLDDVMTFRNDITLKIEGENIIVNYAEYSVRYSVAENSEIILGLLEGNSKLMVYFFGYLLSCLIHKEKYFKKANEDLLNLEAEFMNEYFEKSLTIYKLLSDLAEDKDVQKHITENPDDIIKYISNVLEIAVESGTSRTTNFETESFQSVFTTVMILQLLVSNCSTDELKNYKILIQPLKLISHDTLNGELKDLIHKILEVLKGDKSGTNVKAEEVKTDLDKAIEDICDSLLPVRGHGLMSLTRLVEKKDKNVMQRKQYVLNIFQQNLKNEDSFIYLSAIGGLAAMADVFPDTVLNILCEEYVDCSRKSDDGHEVRMKLGESLVRVIKILGDMAPKYKPLLLNTFLMGAKDDDYLVRASSLSNLGEICRVLGYKLGTIVTEVLVCVHAIITTDKSLEARRAAVTVIRQLLIGLDNEMIAFLKDDILPIYRTLKEIYNNDRDDVMRLQAQLALEELNENMRNFVFPKPQLSMEKKIVMLN